MGNLHQGHIALVAKARPLGDVTVASIFVNRLQFAPHEDFDRYPRTLQRDADLLRAAGCDIVFAPAEAELYPAPQKLRSCSQRHRMQSKSVLRSSERITSTTGELLFCGPHH